MYASRPVLLDLQLDEIGNAISRIQSAVLARLIRNLQQPVHLALVHAHAPRDRGQALVRRIPRLADHVDVEKVRLPVEQRGAKGPELVGLELEDGVAGFVDERAGRVPGLDVLAEDEDQVGPVFPEQRVPERGRVDGLEHLRAEGAHVVKIWMRPRS